MTPERERLVRAVQEAQRRQDAADVYSLSYREYHFRRHNAESALAAYDAAHPEEGK